MIRESEAGVAEKKDAFLPNLPGSTGAGDVGEIDSGLTLQKFLDRIPVNSIPGIRNSPGGLELKTGDTLRDAINLLYEKNVSGAPISDSVETEPAAAGISRFSDGYIGYIDMARMILWSLEKCDKDGIGNATRVEGDNDACNNGMFSMLEQNSQIGQTKVGELATSFLWDPFFPVNLNDTLFHVLLLLSNHRLQVVPVVERPNSHVIGFITQNAVLQLLLRSSGLEWFDRIANKTLSEFQFENKDYVPQVCENKSLADAVHILWKSQLGVIAVVNQSTKTLVGCLRSADVHLLLGNNDLFCNRKTLTMKQFIHSDVGKVGLDPTIEKDRGDLSEETLHLKNNFGVRMDSPLTNKNSDTLKQIMEAMAESKSSFSFLVNELDQVTGVVTSREIIIQFAPPCIDSRIHGVGFFDSALEQSGCHVEGGTIVADY